MDVQKSIHISAGFLHLGSKCLSVFAEFRSEMANSRRAPGWLKQGFVDYSIHFQGGHAG